jgi:SWI/SNF-related matrix-associated actin-dependent regulator of chromatin subfamily A member 5
MVDALATKFSRYKDPWTQLKIVYGANKGKQFTAEEDQFIVSQST